MDPMDDESEYLFEGLVELEAMLVHLATEGEVAYIRLHRVEKAGTPFVGRREWTRDSLGEHLDEEFMGDPFTRSSVSPAEEAAGLASAAVRWVRELCLAQVVGEPNATFKTDVRGPKGLECLGSNRIKLRLREDAPSRRAEGLAPTVSLPDTKGVPGPDGAWGVLDRGFGSLFTRWQQAMFLLQQQAIHVSGAASATLSDVRRANSDTLRHYGEQLGFMRGQLKERDAHIEKLLGELLSLRIDMASLGLDGQRSQASTEVQTTTIKSFIDQLGSLGNTWLASKLGIEPELVAVLQVVRGHPKFLEACRNPKVVRALSDPVVLDMIVETLTGLAAQMPDEPPPAGDKPASPKES